MTKIKRLLKKLTQGESGQGALGIVLILLLLGGFILPPLLSFMGTGLKAGQMHEVKTEGYYAADSGIEDACWKIKKTYNPFPSDTPSYPIGHPDAGKHYYVLPDPVNGMHVEVVEQEPPEELPAPKGAILYTIKASAWLEGDPTDEEHKKGEIIAEIIGESHGLAGESGPGHWPNPAVVAEGLTAIDWKTLAIASIKQGSGECRFYQAVDGAEITFDTNDLLALDVSKGHAWECLDGSNSGWDINAQDFGVVDYPYPDNTTQDLLLSVAKSTGGDPEVLGEVFQNDDIVELDPKIIPPTGDIQFVPGSTVHVNPPLYRMQDYFKPHPHIGITAFSVLPDNHIIFSADQDFQLASGPKYKMCQLIEFDPAAKTFNLYLDVGDILSKDSIIITAVTPLLWKGEDGGSDQCDARLLLSFNDTVTGTDTRQIAKGDIALWNPKECPSCEEGICSLPCPWNAWYAAGHDPCGGSINIHINMHETGEPSGPPQVDLTIKSWNIEE